MAKQDTYAGHISDSELQKADFYVGEAGKGFTATAEDFKNKDIFLTNTLAGNTNKDSAYYNAKKEFIQNSAAIKDSELDFLERFSSSVDRSIREAKGAVTGVATGAKDTVVGIYEFGKSPIDNTKELINSTIEAAKNPVQTAKNVSEGIDQGLEKYNTTIDLYKMQKDEGAEAEYKANIAGQIVGAGGVGAIGKKGAEATIDTVKKAQQAAKEAEIAEVVKEKQIIENNANTDNNVLDNSLPREEFWDYIKSKKEGKNIKSPSEIRNLDVMNGLMQQNGIKLKDGMTKEQLYHDVYNTPEGKRPDPSTYLSPSYIKEWSKSWSDGAVRFTNIEDVNKYSTIGGPNGFIIPKSEFDKVIKESNGDLAYIEKKLSLPEGQLSKAGAVAYWVKPQNDLDIKIPAGNEGGANTQWLPGGKTANGLKEGVTDLTNSNLNYEEIKIGSK